MEVQKFDFNDAFNKAWDMYKENLMLLVGATFVAALLISFSMGILTGPLSLGLFLLVLQLDEKKEAASFGALFDGFTYFVPTFLLCLVWGIAVYALTFILMLIPIVGSVIAMLLGFAFTPFLCFALILVADKKRSFSESSSSAWELVKANFWPLVGYGIVASFLSGIGALACGIGVIFTMPLFYVMLATAYRSCIPLEGRVEERAAPAVDISQEAEDAADGE